MPTEFAAFALYLQQKKLLPDNASLARMGTTPELAAQTFATQNPQEWAMFQQQQGAQPAPSWASPPMTPPMAPPTMPPQGIPQGSATGALGQIVNPLAQAGGAISRGFEQLFPGAGEKLGELGGNLGQYNYPRRLGETIGGAVFGQQPGAPSTPRDLATIQPNYEQYQAPGFGAQGDISTTSSALQDIIDGANGDWAKIRSDVVRYMMGLGDEDSYEYEKAVDLLNVANDMLKGGAGGAGGLSADASAYIAQQQRELEERARQFGITEERQRDEMKNRLEEAIAQAQLERLGLLAGSHQAAQARMAQVAPATLPSGMDYIPGREPGGVWEQLGSKLGFATQPMGREATTQMSFGTEIPQIQSQSEEALRRLMGG